MPGFTAGEEPVLLDAEEGACLGTEASAVRAAADDLAERVGVMLCDGRGTINACIILPSEIQARND